MRLRIKPIVMFAFIVLAATLSFAVVAVAQEQKPPDPPGVVHLTSTDVAFKIRDVQWKMQQLQNQAQQYQSAMQNLSKQYTDDHQQLQELQAEAFKAQKLSETAYTFDPSTLDFLPKAAFTPKPLKPAPPPAKPEKRSKP